MNPGVPFIGAGMHRGGVATWRSWRRQLRNVSVTGRGDEGVVAEVGVEIVRTRCERGAVGGARWRSSLASSHGGCGRSCARTKAVETKAAGPPVSEARRGRARAEAIARKWAAKRALRAEKEAGLNRFDPNLFLRL